MNVPKEYEQALATVIRDYAYDIGPDTQIRCWRNLQFDPRWKAEIDRTFPCIDIRCSSPARGDDQHTLSIAADVQIYTQSADDISHAMITKIEESVSNALDNLFYGFLSGTDETENTTFNAEMLERLGTDFSFGGFSFGEGVAPTEDGAGHLVSGFQLMLHYSRRDY